MPPSPNCCCELAPKPLPPLEPKAGVELGAEEDWLELAPKINGVSVEDPLLAGVGAAPKTNVGAAPLVDAGAGAGAGVLGGAVVLEFAPKINGAELSDEAAGVGSAPKTKGVADVDAELAEVGAGVAGAGVGAGSAGALNEKVGAELEVLAGSLVLLAPKLKDGALFSPVLPNTGAGTEEGSGVESAGVVVAGEVEAPKVKTGADVVSVEVEVKLNVG